MTLGILIQGLVFLQLGAHFQVINAHEAVDQPLKRDYGDIAQDICVYFPICDVEGFEHAAGAAKRYEFDVVGWGFLFRSAAFQQAFAMWQQKMKK